MIMCDSEHIWNFRIIKNILDNNEFWYGIHEVHYDNGIPVAHTEKAMAVSGESIEDITWYYKTMGEAFTLPVLIWDDKRNRYSEE
jgi:phosphosulfolactate synthase (CoM biosynthesis protein A)